MRGPSSDNSHTTTLPSSLLEHQDFHTTMEYLDLESREEDPDLDTGIREDNEVGDRNVMEDLLEPREEDGDLDSRVSEDNEMGDHKVMELTEPEVGMIFESEIQAQKFYASYARAKGFGVTISNSKKRKGIRYWVQLSCHKNRLAKKPVDPMASHPTTKTNCKAAMKISRQFDDKWKVNSINLEHNHDMDPKTTKYLRCYRNLPAHIQRDI